MWFFWPWGIHTIRVCLDTTENWKLKTEKYCSKIIFKYMNSIVGPIFNEKVTEKWNLWIYEQIGEKSKKSQTLQLRFIYSV